MNWAAQCAVVIPCLNEARTIRQVVAGARAYLPRVYVVDDGSSDQTAALAREAGAVVLSHPAPQGKGASLRDGLSRAAADGFAWAITLDADGQHDPADLPRFLAAAETAPGLVLGNRMGDPRGMPAVRLFVNRWMSRRLSSMTGRPLPDSQCGYRMIRLAAIAGNEFQCRHFEFESEILLVLARAGYPFEFVPIRAIYQGEQSKIRPLIDTLRWFKWWLRARATLPAPGKVSPPALSGTLAQRPT